MYRKDTICNGSERSTPPNTRRGWICYSRNKCPGEQFETTNAGYIANNDPTLYSDLLNSSTFNEDEFFQKLLGNNIGEFNSIMNFIILMQHVCFIC